MIDIEIIKKYHQNLLSPEEVKKVEQALEDEEDLRRMYEGYIAFMSNHSEIELKKSALNVNSRIQNRVHGLEEQKIPIVACYDDSDIIEEILRDKRRKKRASNYIKVAVAASIVLVLGITFLFLKPNADTPIIADKPKQDATKDSVRNKDSNNTPLIADKDSIKTNKPKESNPVEEDDTPHQLIAYNENPELELLVNNHIRSATKVKNIQPENSKEFKKGEAIEINFTFSQEDEFEVFILNSKGKVIDNIELQIKGSEVSGSFNAQDEGLYYWKLEGEEDLLHVGKFIVR